MPSRTICTVVLVGVVLWVLYALLLSWRGGQEQKQQMSEPPARPDNAMAAISTAVIVSACPVPYAPRQLGQPSAPPAKPSEMTYRWCIPSSYRCLTPQAVSYLRTWLLFLEHTL